jgi:hypothetical protein
MPRTLSAGQPGRSSHSGCTAVARTVTDIVANGKEIKTKAIIDSDFVTENVRDNCNNINKGWATGMGRELKSVMADNNPNKLYCIMIVSDALSI